jgi:hypothetical protein
MKISTQIAVVISVCALIILQPSVSRKAQAVHRYGGPPKLRVQDPTTTRPNGERSNQYSVDVKSVIAVSTPEARAYLIEYSYRFRQLTEVYIKTIGLVPARGEQKYITYDKQIEFRRSAEGPVLLIVPIEETIILQSPISQCTFKDTDFITTYKEGPWPGADQTRIALNKFFGSGYSAREENHINIYKTSCITPPGLSPGLIAEVAFEVSHPFRTTNGTTLYRIRWAAHEARVHSTMWRQPGDEVRTAAEKSMCQFMSKVESRIDQCQ